MRFLGAVLILKRPSVGKVGDFYKVMLSEKWFMSFEFVLWGDKDVCGLHPARCPDRAVPMAYIFDGYKVFHFIGYEWFWFWCFFLLLSILTLSL